MNTPVAAPPTLSLDQVSVPENVVPRLLARYNEAYLIARTLATVGQVLDWGAKLVAGIAVFAAVNLFASPESGKQWPLIALVAGGILAALFLYVAGVLVGAIGQILKAHLDAAVNSSPFLNNGQRAIAMSL